MRNPFITALWAFTGIFLAVAITCGFAGQSQNALGGHDGDGLLAFGGTFLLVGLSALLIALLASAIRWQPTTVTPAAAAPDHTAADGL